jgi:iron(III) transport system ATP-binding protein
MTSVRLEHITKTFTKTTALSDINLTIPEGELFFLLGPSGCGKSTLLRIIAGLESPTSGGVFFNDRDVTPLGTERRNAVMVFQSYALWPHMTVRENIAFGLQVRGLSTQEQSQRVDQILEVVRMRQLADRKPNQMSGGQQQRVALARALAVQPDCLLLDEPLSNLDAQLRQQMRGEIRRICKSQGVTTIYVTHDQKEALSIADRIAVMNAGQIVQIGKPAELYHQPRTPFVARFIGETNLLPGAVLSQSDGVIRVKTAAGEILASAPANVPQQVILSIRPEQLRLVPASATPSTANRLVGKVTESTFLGEASEHVLVVNGQPIKAISSPPRFDPPEEMAVMFEPSDAIVLEGRVPG